MLIVNILIYILIFELFLLAILVIALYLKKNYNSFQQRSIVEGKRNISKLINDCLLQKKKISDVQLDRLFSTEIILSVLESYNRRLKDEVWEKLKQTIAEQYLLPYARSSFNSIFWTKRNFSSRCFALSPSLQDEQKILPLIEDSVFLVRSHAAHAIARMGTYKGIKKIILHMSTETGYAYFFYRDILLQEGSVALFNEVEKIAIKSENPSVESACLDLLSSKSMTLSNTLLNKYIYSFNEKLRLQCIKVYAQNPQHDSPEILLKCIDDPLAEIRAQAAYGLGYFLSAESLEKLERALSDTSWNVRLQAAWSLKRMGKKGLAILNKQAPEINKKGFDAAQYALQFDW